MKLDFQSQKLTKESIVDVYRPEIQTSFVACHIYRVF